jgi:hypothetical protein
MKKLWLPAGIAFLLAGFLEVLFMGLSCMGVAGGAFITAGVGFRSKGLEDLKVLGPLMIFFYAVWFVCTLVAGPLHMIAGASMTMGGRNRTLLWAAVAASILPAFTVYCAPTSLIAGLLGLLAAAGTAREEPPESA